jgi:hypothetical protein
MNLPDELTIMTEMLAVLADCSQLGGTDTEAGMEALLAGSRRLAHSNRSPYFLLTLALSGWLGALEGIAAQGGIPMAEVIKRYASALAETDDELRGEAR